jgi:hypothetical protein
MITRRSSSCPPDTTDAKREPRQKSNKQPRRAITTFKPAAEKIGEGKDNLRDRAEAFKRRRRSST